MAPAQIQHLRPPRGQRAPAARWAAPATAGPTSRVRTIQAIMAASGSRVRGGPERAGPFLWCFHVGAYISLRESVPV